MLHQPDLTVSRTASASSSETSTSRKRHGPGLHCLDLSLVGEELAAELVESACASS